MYSKCSTPGLKIRSKGLGRGLARGKGRGPLGVPASVRGRKRLPFGNFRNIGF
jgi:hypothetical protein